MYIDTYAYRNIYWNEGEEDKVCKTLKYYASIGYSDCQTEIREKGIEEPSYIDTGEAKGFDYCTQIHKYDVLKKH